MLVPERGGPAVLVLSFCDSAEIAALLRDTDVAVISFEGDVRDTAGQAFTQYLYDSLALGHTVGSAFEIAAAAVTAVGKAVPRLTGHGPGRHRPLPRR